MKMRLIFALFLLAALAAAASPVLAMSCTCSPDPFENRWNNVDTVFSGTVTDITELRQYLRKDNANDMPVKVTLNVTESFKGAAKKGKTFVLQTSLTRDTCTGHPFEKGGEYLVWGYVRRDDKYEPWSLYGNMPAGSYDVGGLCGGTHKLSDPAAVADLDLIKKKRAAEAEEKPKGMFDKLFGN